MAKNANYVSHKKSKQIVDGKPKLPLASELVEGEIAINFGKDVETLSIKNESGDVVTFSCDNYYTEKKLGSGFTGENSANTVTSVVGSGFISSSITDVIIENEEIVSAALTDLDERKLDVTAYTPTEELWESGTGLNSVVLKNSSGTASGDFAVAEGYKTSATTYQAHAEGSITLASGNFSHAEGYGTKASGSFSHTEGELTTASGQASHAEGRDTLASGDRSHAEGFGTTASGYYSHAEGSNTVASGNSSHAEGFGTSATTNYSHAEGYNTKASGQYSHVEGNRTTASGQSSHAEGDNTTASDYASHAEGNRTTASGLYSHAEGNYTIANNQSEHASGQYNVSNSASTTFGDSGNTLFSVGNGTYGERHNAFEIRQNGDIYIVSGNSDIKLQDYIGGGGGSITVDQVLDDTTSASTNPVSSKAVYNAVTDNELVWTNAYVILSGVVSSHTENTNIHLANGDREKINSIDTLSGTVTAHTANTEIHVTTADKEKLHTHSNKSALDSITGNVGTMAYQSANSYSSATQVNTALADKADKAADLDNVKIKKITQSDYDALVQAGTVDSNTLYFIYD